MVSSSDNKAGFPPPLLLAQGSGFQSFDKGKFLGHLSWRQVNNEIH